VSDDGLAVIGGEGESGRRVLPGSSVARRRHDHEDDGLAGIGVGPRPKLKRARRPTGLYEMWRSITDPLYWDSETDTSFAIHRPIFNKHVQELRCDYTDAEIIEGFREFVRQVQAGRIALTNKTAWFVFYSRRSSLVRRSIEDGFVPRPETAEELRWDPGAFEPRHVSD
jgi:hypothetical protein